MIAKRWFGVALSSFLLLAYVAGCGTSEPVPTPTPSEANIETAVAETLTALSSPDAPTATETCPPANTPVAGAPFQDFERCSPEDDCFEQPFRMECSLAKDVIHQGAQALRCEVPAAEGDSKGGTVGVIYSSSGSIDLSSATTISVWVYDTVGKNTVQLRLHDVNGCASEHLWSEMESCPDEWRQITWSLSEGKLGQLAAEHSLEDCTSVDMSQIKSIEFYEFNQGVYYFDEASHDAVTPTSTSTNTATPTLTATSPPTQTPTPTPSETPAPTPRPTPFPVSYQDFESCPFEVSCFREVFGVSCSLVGDNVHQASRALRCKAYAGEQEEGKEGGTVGIYSSTGGLVDLSSVTAVAVWVYDTQGGQAVELKLSDANKCLSEGQPSEKLTLSNRWVQVIWLLPRPININQDLTPHCEVLDLSQVRSIELYVSSDGIYYMDSVGLFYH